MAAYLLFRSIIAILFFVPFGIIHLISNGLSWLATVIPFYRKKVVLKNLSLAFPDSSPKEMRHMLRASYQNLFDVALGSLKSYSMSNEAVAKRFTFSNPEVTDSEFENGKHVIAFAEHLGNWEWGPTAVPIHLKHQIIGLIKPIKNKRIYDYICEKRRTTGSKLLDIYQSKRIIFEEHEKPIATIYIADQNPSNTKKSIKVKFFDIETHCLHGGEAHAKKTNDPVYHFKTTRTGRSRYNLAAELITKDPSSEPDGRITEIYMQQLEQLIKDDPGAWLWTHKRWKHTISYK